MVEDEAEAGVEVEVDDGSGRYVKARSDIYGRVGLEQTWDSSGGSGACAELRLWIEIKVYVTAC